MPAPYPMVPNYVAPTTPTYQNPFQLNNLALANMQQQQNQLIRVNGLDSAKAYPTQPNSMIALFDENDDIMYIKTTDASNFPTIKTYRFIEEKEAAPPDISEFVTMDEFQELKEELTNVKQSISANQRNRNKSNNHQPKPSQSERHDGDGQEQQ